MFKPTQITQSCKTQVKLEFVPIRFNLLSWNIYKINHKTPYAFQHFIRSLQQAFGIGFYCLQEAKHTDSNTFPLSDFCLHFAANLQLKNHAYGVMTASNVISHKAQQILSKKTEFLFKTHKSSLVNHYLFEDQTPLIIINVHAINFNNSRVYAEEIEQLQDYLTEFKDTPLIIAGDFNSWNKKRNYLIEQFCIALNLIQAQFENNKNIKRFAKHPLDLVMYRNLTCEYAIAIDSQKISDHNPLLLKFIKY
ncbi:endonuclease/exonuclease/phosphatase family protein [Fastidiosibacter lacustris]|uniref:endonuclease/exonuclease/phosphatase family protein n=1 Tax=Fastidiosibacter lacustris TaxID=2056695 RepID=UPI000E34E768|nr:endonuclease/exonuclease/phosphatase family protein [Fastidiosibacter lacustris]